MNPAEPAGVPQIGLPPVQFAAAFPFHLAVDSALTVRQVGATLRRLCSDVGPGINLNEVFRSVRPEGELSVDWISEHRARFFLLEHRATRLQLRGEFVLLPGEQTWLFLGSPWFTDSAEIAARGLGFDDFAIHDPVVDMLQVFQASKMALADAKKLAAKLTAQRAELRAANERLRQQEAETRTLAMVAARTDNAVVLTDATGATIWVNEGFTRITGYTLVEMFGRRPGSVLQGPGTDPETVRRIGAQLRKGEGFSEEILNYGKNGRSYWLDIDVQPIRDAAGQLTNFMAVERDISVRRAAQQRLAIQFEVARVLTEANNLATAIPGILQAVCEHLGWQIGQLWRVVGDKLRFVDVWHPVPVRAGEFIGTSRARSFAAGSSLPGRVWASRQPRWVADVTTDPDFCRRDEAARDGLRGGFAFPVMVRGAVWGVVEFFSRNIEEPDEALLQSFQAVGSQIGQFIVRREAEEALRESNTLQRAILGGANYAIISTAIDGTIETFNTAAERMLGYASEELVGRATPAGFHDPAEVAQRASVLTRELGRTVGPGFEVFVAGVGPGQPDEREWTYIRKDGSRFPVLLSVTALIDERGQVTGYLGVASDITERKRAAGDLVKAKEAAETANRAKSDFLAMMSHEIRTPMNGVLGMTDLLLGTPLNDRQREYARTVASSGEALIEIINDILDFSKIEAGDNFRLEVDVFSLPELVDGVIELLRPRAVAKGISLVAEIEPGVPQELKGDDGRLRQVLMNLVGNGIKFTDRGGVAVRVRMLAHHGRGQRLQFEVTDTGIGIGAADQARLFQPFTQAGDGRARRRGGTGLGLAISKRIVELMGGSLGLESEPGRGSRFWFELDLEVATSMAVGTEPGSVSRPASGGAVSRPTRSLRILVAEDHETNRRLALFMLESLGHRADFAGNGREAVEAWSRGDYDVILMDGLMPEMDGFQAAREIRRQEAARSGTGRPRVRIIALTANALKGDRERCLAAGMDDYVSKPFTLQDLRAALDSVPAPAGPAPEPSVGRALVGRLDFDPTRPARLCAELDDEGVGAILEDVLLDLPVRAVELASLAAEGRWVELGRLAHSLQGLVATFGLAGLATHFRDLETAAHSGNTEEVRRLIGPLPEYVEKSAGDLRRWLEARRRGAANPG